MIDCGAVRMCACHGLQVPKKEGNVPVQRDVRYCKPQVGANSITSFNRSMTSDRSRDR
jgi:hypothetical protein